MSANTSCLFSRLFNSDPLTRCNIIKTYFDGNTEQYDSAIKLYNEFIKKYGIELLKYNIDLRDPGQRSQRFITFIKIVNQINEHNNDPSNTWSKEINLFTVLEDFEVSKGLKPNPAPGPAPAPAPGPAPGPAPDQTQFNNFSWSNYKDKNYVSEPKNQINLECCWAFGGIEAIETVNAINTDSLVKGSVQHLLRVYSNNSNNSNSNNNTTNCQTTCGINYLQAALIICGDTDTNYQVFDTNGNVTTIKYNNDDLKQSLSGGIAKLNDNNKYTGICPGCDTKYILSVLPNTCVESFDIYNNISIAALKSLLDNGPVLAEINVSNIKNHRSGVIGGKKLQCGGSVSPDHVILIIGYGYDETSKLNYWLCKNSWGTNWGEELPAWAVAPDQKSTPGNVNAGYFKVEANADNIICIQKQVIGNIKLK
jgi:hypothetical protein